MRARMNRKILLSYLKSMVRVVPQSNSIMELMGFMIECNEDEGVVYITVSNLETTIQRKFNASIEEGGSYILIPFGGFASPSFFEFSNRF